MTLNLQAKKMNEGKTELLIIPTFNTKSASKKEGKKKSSEKKLINQHWPSEFLNLFSKSLAAKHFSADVGESISLTSEVGQSILFLGLGDKKDLTAEVIRKQFATLYKGISQKFETAAIMSEELVLEQDETQTKHVKALTESLHLVSYTFDRHLSNKKKVKLETIYFLVNESATIKSYNEIIAKTKIVTDAVSLARDFVNEAPNILHSEFYAKEIQKDAKKLNNVTVKVLGKAELKKEKMGMFLSVNAGSAYEPQLVHLTYTPSNANKNTRHIALVGKGLTFDTGGYSLKPAANMMNMKTDMAGSATVYAAFKAAVQLKLPVKISCFLGITDNAVSSHATMPDSIVTARNGKTVEILNTDAEGRLVLGDVVNYACDKNPDVLIDAATLTGAVIVSLGSEVCGLFSNEEKLAHALLDSAKRSDEYMWQLPMIEEHKSDMKSHVADLKNIGSNGNGGSAKGAIFIQQFLKPGIQWAHLDIAGISDSQSHLPYCQAKGASGLIVRTLVDYLSHV